MRTHWTAAAAIAAIAIAAAVVPPAYGAAKGVGSRVPSQAVSPKAGLTAVVTASRSARSRTGMGLPPYAKLLGRGWARKAARADAALVGRFGSKRSRSHRAAAAKAPVKPPMPNDVDPFGASDSIKGPGGSQKRNLKISTALESGCPVAGPEGYFYFEIKGSARGVYDVTTTERVGRYDVTTFVVFDVRFAAHATVGSNATFQGIANDSGTVSVTRRQTVRDRRNGRTVGSGRTQRLTQDISPLFELEGDFEAFIRAQDDPEYAPGPRLPRGAVWSDMAQRAIALVFNTIAQDFAAAEKRMQTPNTCVTVSFTGPERLAPGQETPLRGILHQTQGDASELKLLKDTRAIPEWVNFQGQAAIPHSRQHFEAGKDWYTFKAPPQAWPESRPVGVKFHVITEAGVAEGQITYKPLDSALHYKILNATASYHTSATSDDILCGQVSGQQSFTGSFAPTDFDPNDKITIERGRWSGQVIGLVNGRWFGHHLDGCKAGSHGLVPCSADMPDRTPRPDGTKQVSFAVYPSSDPNQVELHWSMDQPEVGFIDAGDDECHVHIWDAFDNQTRVRRVPIAQLQSTGPIMLTFTGTGHLTTNSRIYPASIDHSWTYSLTIQRVGPDGRPLA